MGWYALGWFNNGNLQGVLLCGGAVLVWALALYVATRAPTRRATLLAAAAMLCLAIYLMGEGLGEARGTDLQTWADWLRQHVVGARPWPARLARGDAGACG